MPIPSEVREDKRHMHPARARLRVLLPNQLIKRQIVADVIKPLAALLYVAVDAEVRGLAFQMLRVIHTANGFVESLAAEAAANLDRLIHGYSERFEYIGAQIDEVNHLLYAGFVVDAFRLRCC